jgi:carboxyl-terminal processing protease
MRKYLLPGFFIVLLFVLIGSFSGKGEDKKRTDSLSARQELLMNIGFILEQKHYSPKKIDDSFSQLVFKNYLDDLDSDKDILLASDIAALQKYATTIDDEIHGAPMQFFPAITAIYKQRLQEASQFYKTILLKPFDFTVDEKVQLDGEKVPFPASQEACKEVWRKKLKYLTLERYIELQELRNKGNDSATKNKTDVELEQQAREKVKTIMERNFDRMAKTFTEDKQFDMFINTITNAMDPHTAYFPPVEKRSFYEDMSGRFYGIGAQLREDDGAIKIVSLVVGTPAWKSGKIQVNDIIVKVAQGNNEPVDVTGYPVDEVVKLIRGEKGTVVKLTLRKQDGILDTVSLVRDEIVQDETFARSAILYENNKKIGYIYLPEFYTDFERANGARCSQDVAAEVRKLKNENVQGIIVDLRGNPGGSLPEVSQMVGLFIKKGPVVQVKDRDGKPALWSDDDDSVLYTGPLAVMVNEGSASASEIFAAAIQDYKRGIVVGSSSTFGKGTVQRPIPLGNTGGLFSKASSSQQAALVLTFEKFYRITGGSTQLKGVVPDIILPDPFEYLKFREKDMPTALPWDQIQPAVFEKWNSRINWQKVQQNAEQRIQQNTAFQRIKQNTLWLDSNAGKEYELNIEKYKLQQQKIKNIVQENDSLTKLETLLNIQPVSVDYDKFFNNADKPKGERYKQWLNNLKKDLYLSETMLIVLDMQQSNQYKIAANQKMVVPLHH